LLNPTCQRDSLQTANGMMPRTTRRPIYETVATAVYKMLGAIMDQKLAFLLPLEAFLSSTYPICICVKHTGQSRMGSRPGDP
jgi:hypothetical protein